MLNWSAADLTKTSGICPAKVCRYETQDGIPTGATSTPASIQSALEYNGI